MSEIGDIIKSLRVKAGLTQEELGARVGVSRSAVSLWEIGVSEPSVSNVRSMAKIFDISPMEIMGRKSAVEGRGKDFVSLFNSLDEAQQDAIVGLMKVM